MMKKGGQEIKGADWSEVTERKHRRTEEKEEPNLQSVHGVTQNNKQREQKQKIKAKIIIISLKKMQHNKIKPLLRST